MPNRTNTHTISLAAEATYGVLNGPEAYPYSPIQWGFDPAALTHQVIENQAVSPDLGEYINGAGLQAPDSKVSFNTYSQGLGEEIADGNPATESLMAIMLAACLGEAPEHSTATTVKPASSPTTTVIVETDAASHVANSLVGFKFNDGHVEVRPVTTYATDTMTLGMPLSAAPAEGDKILGATLLRNSEDVDASMQASIIGENDYQNFKARGMVGNFTIDQVGKGEAQTMSFEYMVNTWSTNFSGTQATQDDYVPIPIAGGEFKMLVAGDNSNDPISLCIAGLSFSLNREYVDLDCIDDNETGISLYKLLSQKAELTVKVYDDAALPTGAAESTWYESFLANSKDSNKWQILLSFGQQTAGNIFAMYIKQGHVKAQPLPSDQNGMGAFELKIALTSGITDNLMFLIA